MTETFVPLLPAGTVVADQKPTSYRMKVNPPGKVADGFAPINLQPAPKPSASASHTASNHQCAPSNPGNVEPTITLEREGDHVTHIRIQCGCGQIMEFECVY